MSAAIQAEVLTRGITRLCHFTPARNLAHIASEGSGLLAVSCLTSNERAIFNSTDLRRLDGYSDYICCSIQYPNAWYFQTARCRETLFRDWVVLFVKSDYLWHSGTKFCPRNAASGAGRGIGEGQACFQSLFESSVVGANQRRFSRGFSHPSWLPTDEQAEVLVLNQIHHKDILGVAVASESQARLEYARLQQIGIDKLPPFIVAPDFYNPRSLSSQLRVGTVPSETMFIPGDVR